MFGQRIGISLFLGKLFFLFKSFINITWGFAELVPFFGFSTSSNLIFNFKKIGRNLFLENLKFKWVNISLFLLVLKFHKLLKRHCGLVYSITLTFCKVTENAFLITWSDSDVKTIHASLKFWECYSCSVFEIKITKSISKNLESLLNISIYKFQKFQ